MTLVAGSTRRPRGARSWCATPRPARWSARAGAEHPDGTEVHPSHWWTALQEAIAQAGGLDDVAAVSVGGQQHGMVCLDENGEVVRPALLWNDIRSAQAARDLIAELGGPEKWAEAVGSVPVASFTVTKLRWLAQHEPENAARTASVCLPHDWLTWKLGGTPATITTDRGEASGTGYWSPATGNYRLDLLEHGHRPHSAGRQGPRPARAGRASTTRRCWRRAPVTTWPPPSASAPTRAT